MASCKKLSEGDTVSETSNGVDVELSGAVKLDVMNAGLYAERRER
jgi:hypothetical protein